MSLEEAFQISAQGINTQATRMQTHVSNIANMDTPYYVRKIPVISENNDLTFGQVLSQMEDGVFATGLTHETGGVKIEGMLGDPTPGKRVYQPGHPQADKNGYITLSNVNIVSDMADATLSARAYEANLAVLGIVKGMSTRALDIGRGQ